MLKAVVQEHSRGCGIACVACVAGTTYSKALKMTSRSPIKGYCCRDIVKILEKLGLKYDYRKVTTKTKKYLEKEGTVVFIKHSDRYPLGHFLVKTDKGWMNPWINYPNVTPTKAGFIKKLPGKAQWIIFNRDLL